MYIYMHVYRYISTIPPALGNGPREATCLETRKGEDADIDGDMVLTHIHTYIYIKHIMSDTASRGVV